MHAPITVNYVPDGKDWTVTVTDEDQTRSATASGLIAARDQADQIVEKMVPEQTSRTVVHLLEGDAVAFTNTYLQARLGLSAPTDPEPPKDTQPTPEPSPANSQPAAAATPSPAAPSQATPPQATPSPAAQPPNQTPPPPPPPTQANPPRPNLPRPTPPHPTRPKPPPPAIRPNWRMFPLKVRTNRASRLRQQAEPTRRF